MIILTIRTDKPEAEIGIFDGNKPLAYHTWPADRQLAETIHTELKMMLKAQDRVINDVEGIVAYTGPGSFTGLRIGLSVANALAVSLPATIVGETGDDWLSAGSQKLQNGINQRQVIPEYGSLPHITAPRK